MIIEALKLSGVVALAVGGVVGILIATVWGGMEIDRRLWRHPLRPWCTALLVLGAVFAMALFIVLFIQFCRLVLA